MMGYIEYNALESLKDHNLRMVEPVINKTKENATKPAKINMHSWITRENGSLINSIFIFSLDIIEKTEKVKT